ncbi:ABC transporter permease [Candidatus Hakubella thermalkaliphila]|uniref:Iron(III) transport system permease protein n=1 Tax=Candidatus Hakubella thermalkaliphila TaxID=2754717 RepID=A0A6V8P9Q1_9ACTN|nr:iron ABC transporter permease [Candidatus Hakubella thermalkaliphila]GFP24991.1 iron(III) transport system permease protein [Candidatus Hakubella thermalkaliphila]GFP27556.1 iron(III) transport system permease protein [Candidatus Hakubella thermalkaliphila]
MDPSPRRSKSKESLPSLGKGGERVDSTARIMRAVANLTRSWYLRCGHWLQGLPVSPLLIAAVVMLPVGVVSSALLTPTRQIWIHLWDTLLPEMLSNTFVLLLGVGVGTLLLGTGLAWLMVAYRFPGQTVLNWLLVLPMAVPTYVLGFVYMATFDFAGPVQSILRQWFGQNIWFPKIRSGGGAILVMVLVLYPYVYLLAKAGFYEQSGATFEEARVLGYSRAESFFRIALPLARPSIVAGLTLAMMEALTDFATVRFFNFPTLSDGVIRIWHGMMDLRAASELSGLLVIFVLLIILFGRSLRGRSRYYQVGGKVLGIPPVNLRGWKRWFATSTCSLVVAVAFALPVMQLFHWALIEITRTPAEAISVYLGLTFNSLLLSVLAAGFATAIAMILANGVRLSEGRVARTAAHLATMGYAIPGAVIAVGILVPLSTLDHTINDLLQSWWGITIGLIFTGSVVGLTYAYVVRFMAVAYNSVESSLEKITPNITMAARTLGASPWKLLWRIHLPLVGPGMFVGASLVFVDVMKELPITVMLRPFGYDTLAVWVWQMAAESIWAGASLPALIIVIAGLLPVILLIGAATPKRSK